MTRKTDIYSMKSLVTIHKILKIYDDNLDADNLDIEALNAKTLKISENRFSKIIIMLSKAGYIENVDIREFQDGTTHIDYSESYITLAGLKYYAENTLFLRASGLLPELISAGITTITNMI